MGKKNDKLRDRLLAIPNDLKYSELKTILESFGYFEDTKGKTSGSRVMFINNSDSTKISGHKPHGNDAVSIGWLKSIVKFLKDKGEI